MPQLVAHLREETLRFAQSDKGREGVVAGGAPSGRTYGRRSFNRTPALAGGAREECFLRMTWGWEGGDGYVHTGGWLSSSQYIPNWRTTSVNCSKSTGLVM